MPESAIPTSMHERCKGYSTMISAFGDTHAVLVTEPKGKTKFTLAVASNLDPPVLVDFLKQAIVQLEELIRSEADAG